MKSIPLTILLAWAACAQSTLNADKPVDAVAALAPASVTAGGQGQFTITLKIMEGGHANSNITADPNLIPTSFTPKPAPGITWGRPVYPESKTVTEWYSADPLPVFLDSSVIAVPFTVAGNASAGLVTVSGVVQAQVCDHDQCYPPRRFTVSAQLKIETAKSGK